MLLSVKNTTDLCKNERECKKLVVGPQHLNNSILNQRIKFIITADNDNDITWYQDTSIFSNWTNSNKTESC